MLGVYFVLSLVEAYAGLKLWSGSRLGGVLALAVLPIEAFFWLGFALPFPPFFALVRIILVLLTWRRLR